MQKIRKKVLILLGIDLAAALTIIGLAVVLVLGLCAVFMKRFFQEENLGSSRKLANSKAK